MRMILLTFLTASLAFGQDAPPEAAAPQEPPAVQEPAAQEPAAKNEPEVAVALAVPSLVLTLLESRLEMNGSIPEAFLPNINEKTTSSLIISESEPKNLRFLARADVGLTPIHIAAARGDSALVQALLAAGSRRSPVTKGYQSLPAKLAIENKHFDVARLLLDAPPDAAAKFIFKGCPIGTLVVVD